MWAGGAVATENQGLHAGRRCSGHNEQSDLYVSRCCSGNWEPESSCWQAVQWLQGTECSICEQVVQWPLKTRSSHWQVVRWPQKTECSMCEQVVQWPLRTRVFVLAGGAMAVKNSLLHMYMSWWCSGHWEPGSSCWQRCSGRKEQSAPYVSRVVKCQKELVKWATLWGVVASKSWVHCSWHMQVVQWPKSPGTQCGSVGLWPQRSQCLGGQVVQCPNRVGYMFRWQEVQGPHTAEQLMHWPQRVGYPMLLQTA